MKWFGKSWGAPVNRDVEHTATPVGACALCDTGIGPDDRGVVLPFAGGRGDPPELAYHLGCFLKSLGLTNETRPR